VLSREEAERDEPGLKEICISISDPDAEPAGDQQQLQVGLRVTVEGGQELVGLRGPASRQRSEEAIDLGVDRPQLRGMVALDAFEQATGDLLDRGAAKVGGEAQQVTDGKVLLAAAPGDRLQAKLLDPARDPGGADVDQLGGAREGRQGADVVGAG